MRLKIAARTGFASACAILIAFFGCSGNEFVGSRVENRAPEVWLSSGPVEGDTTGYQVHFYWGGWDPDGEVRNFEFVIADGNPIGFNQQDTTGRDKWTVTSSYDSVFRVSADDSAWKVTINNYLYTRYDRTHTFFLRAVDMEGKRSEPVYRSFTAWTLAPFAQITLPAASRTGTGQLGKVVTFKWKGTDPIDSPNNLQDPDSVRYMYSRVDSPPGRYNPGFAIIDDLNNNPLRYERRWSPWIWYRAPGDSGRSTVLGDDEILEMGHSYIFAVQAKDEAGAVTAIFDRNLNVRQFIVSSDAQPFLTITEPFLGGFQFIGTNLRPEKRDLPPGVTLNFRWHADASWYGGEISCFQWGWDVADLNDPNDWTSECSPFNLNCSGTWYSGVHTLFVQVTDNSGAVTLGQVEIDIVPFTMDRNLLWVDDFPSDNFQQVDYAMPTENQHDGLWDSLCARARDFDPARDVYDAYHVHNSKPPEVALIGRYKNIIWTYSSSLELGAWDDIILFTPESMIGTGSKVVVNYLSIFLSKGGHLLTEGRSDRTGGLGAALQPTAMVYPMNLRCEITGNRSGCAGDTSGVNSMPYREYCVTMLDKVSGVFRTDANMPARNVSLDALQYAARADADPVTAANPALPATLDLWEEVTRTGRYFDPRVRGYNYVEMYDPKYWMDAMQTKSQNCFHPMYLMRTRNTSSPVNNTAIALWLTKYQDVDPDGPGPGVAAPSAHLGFELWFFKRPAVNQLIDVIFTKWGIKAE